MSFLDMLASDEEARDIWVVAELTGGRPTPLTLELIGGGRAIADGLGCYVHAVVLGNCLGDPAPGSGLADLIAAGADRVHLADDPALAAFAVEPYLKVLLDLFGTHKPEIVLFGATPLGDELAARLAQRLRTGLLAHCSALRMDESERVLMATHPVYAGEYSLLTSCPQTRPEIATVLPDAFGPPYLDSYRLGETEALVVNLDGVEARVRLLGPVDFRPLQPPLRHARRIVSAGRQAGDFDLVKRLADSLGAHLAGAREAVDEGWIGQADVVGALGESVRPDLYLAVGVRGDVYHTYGIRDARFVVALHPEADAPIFQVADVGLVGDPRALVPELIEALEQVNSG